MSLGTIVLFAITLCAVIAGELVMAVALFKRLKALEQRHQEQQSVGDQRTWYDRLRRQMVLDALYFLLESNKLLRRPPREEPGRGPREEARP